MHHGSSIYNCAALTLRADATLITPPRIPPPTFNRRFGNTRLIFPLRLRGADFGMSARPVSFYTLPPVFSAVRPENVKKRHFLRANLKQNAFSLRENAFSLGEIALSLGQNGLSLREIALSLKQNGVCSKQNALSLKQSPSCLKQNGLCSRLFALCWR